MTGKQRDDKVIIENADIVDLLIEVLGTSRLELRQNQRPEELRDLIKYRMAGK